MGMEEEILKDFLAESKENLERLDQEFVELEQNPEDAELIKSIFRTIHTIKGTAGFFGYTTLEGIAHFSEDILSKLRDGVVKVNEDITTVLLQSVDHIKAILANLEQQGKEPDDVAYLDFIVDLRNFAEKVGKGEVPAAPAAPPAPESAPEPAAAAEVAPEAAAEAPAEAQGAAPGGEGGEAPPAPEAAPSPPPKKAAPAAPPGAARAPQLTETHVRIDIHLLDKLMNLAGELVLSRNRMVQIANALDEPELLKANQRMSLVVTELQEQIMKTRMQPIGNVFNKFPRIVRDLAKNAEKQVQLQIEGAETELDRSIIEVIKDPLTHMVRNSIDHGIEAPEIRIQKEKPPVGTLVMRAYHEGGHVIIEIQDDGAGIDPARVTAKAVERGVLTPEQAAALSEHEALMLVFQPGFSTAEKVTNISGRGVGMDVVKTNIEKLGGTVELESRLDHGTTVRVKIPLTLAIIPALIVQAADQRYAIPQINLVELVTLSPEALRRDVQVIGGSEFYRLRGDILPLVRLRQVLGLPPGGGDGRLSIVVLNSGGRNFGLVVDGISDSEEIVVKPLGRHLKHIRAYAGTTLMGDGRVALILDVVGIAASINMRAEDTLAKGVLAEGTAAGEQERQFLLIFNVAPGEFFAIPLAMVNRLDKIRAADIEVVGGREVLKYRGHSMPVIRLENFLPVSPLPEQEYYHLIVFHMNEKDVAFLVSNIDDSVEVAVEVEEHTFKQPGLLGSAIVKDRTTLFVDVYRVIETYDPNFFDRPGGEEGRRVRILLAEDSAFYRNMLTSYLTAAGHEVIAAEDGAEAWRLLQEEQVDLVITDIEMPNMDGLELTRKIRGFPRTQSLPVMAVTSLSGEADRRRGLEAGVDDYQVKLDRDLVLDAVKRLAGAALEPAGAEGGATA
ncbi:hybrid sensor histidine kinase/response regulator [Dissulfurirhabdus thermomarina]|uniref:histidine kinase n=1 Tax=Dissulfurirhabdus thermomarina TaxID=1765737 RepID=A0A6N9TP16_DISTH|nr:chemotaxis protein CheW [Dissulfurirhabdus thermomarina]NDY41833.1 hybrid sensor histidine kinase/response regulator [Dissulfurirhabdus thermomarina]NMX22476.1 hybrid sensor histidine kinase/response regulator [Dissulfurirhabdus thermomarina]